MYVYNFNLFNCSSVFYVRLFDVKLPEDDLNEVETCRGLGELYMKVYF
jgi:hypothetical protein